jgi:PAS domain S-box-containing protein
LVDGALHAKLLTDADGRILATNAEAERIFGYTRSELIGARVEKLLPEASQLSHQHLREEYFRNPTPQPMGAGRDLSGLRKDGSRVPIEIGLNPLRENGAPVVLATITDITERKLMEAENQLLVRELSHRVKNSLTLASSIATMTWRSTPEPERFLDIYTGRLQALARGQTDLVQRKRKSANLECLVRREVEDMGLDSRVAISGPAIALMPEQAGPLALAIHELATNAYKYGAFSVPGGSVEIRWDLVTHEGIQWVRMTWREFDGPPVSVPERRGFGSVLIENGIPEAKVDCTFDPAGLRCEFIMAIAAGMGEPEPLGTPIICPHEIERIGPDA